MKYHVGFPHCEHHAHSSIKLEASKMISYYFICCILAYSLQQFICDAPVHSRHFNHKHITGILFVCLYQLAENLNLKKHFGNTPVGGKLGTWQYRFPLLP